MNVEHRVVGSVLQRPWLVANILAFIVGGGLAGGLLRSLEQPHYETGVSAIEAAYIQASSLGVSVMIFGAVLGTAQWLVLRRAFQAGWWVPATCLGWGLAGVIGGFLAGGSISTIGPDDGPVPPIVAALVGYPLSAAVLGGSQWLVLRREVDEAAWWPLGNLSGLIAGFGVALALVMSLTVSVFHLLEPSDFPSAKAWLLVGAVSGIVYGAVTWQALARLRRPERLPPPWRPGITQPRPLPMSNPGTTAEGRLVMKETDTDQSPAMLWASWIAATAFGWAVGWAVGSGLAGEAFGGPVSAGIGGTLAGVGQGVFLARAGYTWGGTWALVSSAPVVIAVGAGVAFTVASDGRLYVGVIGIPAIVIMTVAGQWWVLRKRVQVDRAGWWVIGVLAGFIAGGAAVSLLRFGAGIPIGASGDAILGGIGGAVLGGSMAAINGAVLMRLLGRLPARRQDLNAR